MAIGLELPIQTLVSHSTTLNITQSTLVFEQVTLDKRRDWPSGAVANVRMDDAAGHEFHGVKSMQ